MDITKAKKFLEKQGLDDCHYQDDGMIEHIAEQMEMYHTEQLRLGAVVWRSEQLKAVERLIDFAYEVCPLHREDDLKEIRSSL